MSKSSSILILYMFIRISYDLLLIGMGSNKKWSIKDTGGILSAFIIFGLMFMLMQVGIWSSELLLSQIINPYSDYIVFFIYVLSYEFSRWIYYKKHTKHIQNPTFGIILGNFFFSSSAILIVISIVFLIHFLNRYVY